MHRLNITAFTISFLFLVSGIAIAGVVSHQNKKVLLGAYKEYDNKTRYDRSLLKTYLKTYYKNGKKQNHAVFPGGDIDPDIGVCTDLVVRALRNAGIDLQREVNRSVKRHRKYYEIKKPDRYIDHRRVWVLLRYFRLNYRSLPRKTNLKNNTWLPGDIVIWDINSKHHMHIGIISDKKDRNSGRVLVVHNMGYCPGVFPGIVTIQDVLDGPMVRGLNIWKWKVVGHFRVSATR